MKNILLINFFVIFGLVKAQVIKVNNYWLPKVSYRIIEGVQVRLDSVSYSSDSTKNILINNYYEGFQGKFLLDYIIEVHYDKNSSNVLKEVFYFQNFKEPNSISTYTYKTKKRFFVENIGYNQEEMNPFSTEMSIGSIEYVNKKLNRTKITNYTIEGSAKTLHSVFYRKYKKEILVEKRKENTVRKSGEIIKYYRKINDIYYLYRQNDDKNKELDFKIKLPRKLNDSVYSCALKCKTPEYSGQLTLDLRDKNHYYLSCNYKDGSIEKREIIKKDDATLEINYYEKSEGKTYESKSFYFYDPVYSKIINKL